MAWPRLRKRRSLVTFSNRGGAAAPASASGGDESGAGESVRMIWPGGAAVASAAAPAPASAPVAADAPVAAEAGAEAAAGGGDLPFWDWSADHAELDDPSDAFAPDRPEYPDGPDRPDYSGSRASSASSSGARPPRVAPVSQEPLSRRPRRSDRDRDRDRDQDRDQGLRRPGQAVVTPVAAEEDQPRREGIGQHL